MAKNITFYIDESGTPDEGNLFVIGGYYIIDEQSEWEKNCKKTWEDLGRLYNIYIGTITHRTKVRQELKDEVTAKVLSDFETGAYYIWLQGMRIQSKDRSIKNEYYLSMATQLASDSIEQLLIQFPNEDSFNITFVFENWYNETKLEKEKYKNSLELALKRLQAKYKSANRINSLQVEIAGKESFELPLADYVCNIVYNYYKNPSHSEFYHRLVKQVKTQSIYGYDIRSIYEALDGKDFRTLFMLYLETKGTTNNTHFESLIETIIRNNINRYDDAVMNGIISLIDVLYNRADLNQKIKSIDSLKNLLNENPFPSLESALFCLDSLLLTTLNHKGDKEAGLKCIKQNKKRIQEQLVGVKYIPHIWAFYNRACSFYLDQYNYLKIIEDSTKNIKNLEDLLQFSAEYLSIKDARLDVDIFKMYGTRGQGYMLGTMVEHSNKRSEYIQKAKDDFNKAEAGFTDSKAKLRQLGYLNQLARLTGDKDLFIDNVKRMAKLLNSESQDFMENCALIIDSKDLYFQKEFYIFLSSYGNDKPENSETTYLELFQNNEQLCAQLESAVQIKFNINNESESCLLREAIYLYKKINSDYNIQGKFLTDKPKHNPQRQYSDLQIAISWHLIRYEFAGNFQPLKDSLENLYKMLDDEWKLIFKPFLTEPVNDVKKKQYITNLRKHMYY